VNADLLHELTAELPSWGPHSLREFLKASFGNQLASYDDRRGAYLRIDRISWIYTEVLHAWEGRGELLENVLGLRSHSAFMAGSQLALAGQAIESFALQRVCLEAAGYALHIASHPTLGEAWLRRDESAEARAKVRRGFEQVKVRLSIDTASPKVNKCFTQLYERCIQYGAHPNSMAALASTTMIKNEGKSIFTHAYINDPGQLFDIGVRSIQQVGVCALDLLQLVLPERFTRLGLDPHLASLREGL
jgi:hypothetical protein